MSARPGIVSLAVLTGFAFLPACSDETIPGEYPKFVIIESDETPRPEYPTFTINPSWTKIFDSKGNEIGAIVAMAEGPWMTGAARVLKVKEGDHFGYYRANTGGKEKSDASHYMVSRILRTKTDYRHLDIVNPKSDTLVMNLFNYTTVGKYGGEKAEAPYRLIEGYYFVNGCPVSHRPGTGRRYRVKID